MMGFGMGFAGFGILLMLLFWGALIVGAVWLAKTLLANGQNARSGTAAPSQFSAREILDQRYARGEISREEYERMKADL